MLSVSVAKIHSSKSPPRALSGLALALFRSKRVVIDGVKVTADRVFSEKAIIRDYERVAALVAAGLITVRILPSASASFKERMSALLAGNTAPAAEETANETVQPTDTPVVAPEASAVAEVVPPATESVDPPASPPTSETPPVVAEPAPAPVEPVSEVAPAEAAAPEAPVPAAVEPSSVQPESATAATPVRARPVVRPAQPRAK